MFVQQFYLGGIAHTSYLLGGKNTCAIVDPRRDIDEYLEAADDMGMEITHILETHLHADFVSGHMDLARETGAKIYAPKPGKCEFEHVPVGQGDSFDIEDMHVEVIETPGHTPEHVCYIVTDRSRGDEPVSVFTGDTLFVGDVGRPDLFPGMADELASKLYDSLRNKLMKLPDFCEVYPAHGAGSLCGRAMGAKRWSTIGYERKFNAALQHETEEAFKKSLLTGMPQAPDHFARCSDINRKGPAIVADLPAPRPLPPEDMRSLMNKGHILVDARGPSDFGRRHIPGAYNISGAGNFSIFCGWLLPAGKPILLVADADDEIPMLTIMLRRVGLDDVAGYLENGMSAWTDAGMAVERIAEMSVHELKQMCDAGKPLTILDVRAAAEWEGSHIEGAIHMPLPDTRSRYKELDPDRTIALMCRSGARASTAGSILRQHGFKNLAVVAGGMTAWTEAGYAPRCVLCSLTHGPRVA